MPCHVCGHPTNHTHTNKYGETVIGACEKPIRKAKHRAYEPDGTPKYIRVYDNGGETADRYFCQFTHRPGEHFPHLMMSENPFHPQGVGMHGDAYGNGGMPYDRPTYSHLGKRVRDFWSLPDAVRRCIMQDYVEYWGEFVKAEGPEVWIR